MRENRFFFFSHSRHLIGKRSMRKSRYLSLRLPCISTSNSRFLLPCQKHRLQVKENGAGLPASLLTCVGDKISHNPIFIFFATKSPRRNEEKGSVPPDFPGGGPPNFSAITHCRRKRAKPLSRTHSKSMSIRLRMRLRFHKHHKQHVHNDIHSSNCLLR